MTQNVRITGKTVWFDGAKGYGFISLDGSDKDIFVHFSELQMDGYRTLKEGDAVEFSIADGPKGKPQASEVRKLTADQPVQG